MMTRRICSPTSSDDELVEAYGQVDSGSKREPTAAAPDLKALNAKAGQLTLEHDSLVERLKPWIGPFAGG